MSKVFLYFMYIKVFRFRIYIGLELLSGTHYMQSNSSLLLVAILSLILYKKYFMHSGVNDGVSCITQSLTMHSSFREYYIIHYIKYSLHYCPSVSPTF